MKSNTRLNIFKTVIIYTSCIAFAGLLYYNLTYKLYPPHKINSNSDIPRWISVLFLAPIFEELIFRYPLKYPKYYFFVLFTIVYLFLNSWLRSSLFSFGILALPIIFIILQFFNTSKALQRFYDKNFSKAKVHEFSTNKSFIVPKFIL
jgi:hypothetical protein